MPTRLPGFAALLLALEVSAHQPDAGPSHRNAVDPPAAVGATSPNLVEARDGVLATWLEPAPGKGVFALRFARFTESGWSKPVTVAQSGKLVANWADVPSVVQGAGRSLLAHWAEKSGDAAHAYDVKLARSDDDGRSWRALGSPHRDGVQAEHGFVSLAAEGAVFRATWVDGRNVGHNHAGASALRTAIVKSATGPEQVADDRICDCCGTASSAVVDGGTLVVYRNRDQDETRDIWAVRLSGKNAGQPHPVHVDGWKIAGCPVNGPAVSARGADVAVAWYTYAGSEPSVRLSFSGNGGDSFETPVVIAAAEGRTAAAGRVDVALVSPTEAVVSWLTTERENARFHAARVTREGLMGEPVTIATTRSDRQAGFPKLAAFARGKLMALWTEPGEKSALRATLFDVAALPAPRLPSATKRVEKPTPRSTALANFTATGLDGGSVTSGQLKGSWALVNVWATWCEPCRMELPVLSELSRRYGPRGLSVIGLSVDRDKSDAEIAKFVEQRSVPFPIWRDRDERAAAALGATVLPKTLLIDPLGTIVWSRDGALTDHEPELERLLEQVGSKRKK